MDDEVVAFMLHLYRTRQCPASKDGSCPFPKQTCLDCHNRLFKRRAPSFFGRRAPDVVRDKCTMGFGDPNNCRQKERCKQYHQMEEVNFHPNNYKREKCPNRKHTVDDLTCHMWHHPDEENHGQYDSTRLEKLAYSMINDDPPRALVEYLKRKLEAKAQAQGPGTAPSRPAANERPPSSDGKRDGGVHDARRDDRGKPPAQEQWRPKEYTIPEIVFNYCTRQCQQRDKCTNPECFYFHDRSERRRDPERYTYQACGDVFDSTAQLFMEGAQCASGDDCPLAHNFFEVWYHPSVYKTYLCPYEEERLGSCPFGRVCSHAHGRQERRSPETPVPRPQAQNGHQNGRGAEPRDRDRHGNGGDDRNRPENRDNRARDRPGSNYGDRPNERREESRRSGSGSRGRRDDRDRDDRHDDRSRAGGYRDDRGNRSQYDDGGRRDRRDDRNYDRSDRDHDRERRGDRRDDRRDDGRRSNDRPRRGPEGW